MCIRDRYYDLDVDSSAWGKWAHFDINGQAITLFGVIEDPEFFESRIPYTVDVVLTLALSQPIDIAFEQRPDFYSDLDPTSPSDVYDSDYDGRLTFTRLVYDQSAVVGLIKPKTTASDSSEEGFFADLGEMFSKYPLAMSFLMLILVAAIVGVGNSIRNNENHVVLTNDDSEDEILEAEIV